MGTIDPSLFGLFAAQEDASAKNSATQLEVIKLMDTQESMTDDMVKQLGILKTAEDVTSTFKNASLAEVDSENAAARQALGGSWKDQASRSNYWAREMNDNAQKAYQAEGVMNELKSKDLLSDPLGYIHAQFQLPVAVQAFNHYATRHNIAEESLNELTRAGTDAAVMNAKYIQNTSTEVAQAELDKVAATTKLKQDQLMESLAGKKTAGLTEIANLSTAQANMVHQALQAKNADESMKMHRQQMEATLENTRLLREQRQAAMDLKAQAASDLLKDLQDYNAGAADSGRPQFNSVDSYRRIRDKSFKDPVFMNTQDRGQLINMQGGTVNGVAWKSSGDAAEVYAAPGTNLLGSPVAKMLNNVYESTRLVPGAPTKDRIAFNAEVSVKAEQVAKSMASKIDTAPGKEGNIYVAPPPAIMMKQVKVNSNPFIASLVQPMVDQNADMKLDDSVMVGKAIEFVKGAPNANLNVAVDGISTYYKKAVATNNVQNRYVEHGLPIQKNYPINFDGRMYDLADETQVKLLLLHQMRAGQNLGASAFGFR